MLLPRLITPRSAHLPVSCVYASVLTLNCVSNLARVSVDAFTGILTVASSFIKSFSLYHTILGCVQEGSAVSHPEGDDFSEEGETQALPSLTHSASLCFSSHTCSQESLPPPPHSLPSPAPPGVFPKCLLITHRRVVGFIHPA